ncbi:unnamed protein product [Rotaria sp. Silwood2]|nr:unnamed protein product [Rotaria sp. Silwood2]
MIQCGANVNAVCRYFKERPLHFIAKCLDIDIARPIIELLLVQGAHTDCVDDQGRLPHDLASEPSVKELLRTARRLSLKCRCAQVIISTKMNYRNRLSSNLVAFVRLHCNRETDQIN